METIAARIAAHKGLLAEEAAEAVNDGSDVRASPPRLLHSERMGMEYFESSAMPRRSPAI
jgi:hypothetical protein